MNLMGIMVIVGLLSMALIVGLGVILARRITNAWERNWMEAARLMGLAYNKREKKIIGVLSMSPVSLFWEPVSSQGRTRQYRTVAMAECDRSRDRLKSLYVAPRGLGRNMPADVREKAFLTGDERFDTYFIAAGDPQSTAMACLTPAAREALIRLIMGTLRFERGLMICEVQDWVVAAAHLTAMATAATAAAAGLDRSAGKSPPTRPR